MRKTVKFGAVGASNMGLLHIEAIARHPKMELVAVCDKDPARLEIVQRRVGSTAIYTDWHDLIKSVPTTSYDGECTVAVCVAVAESAASGKTVQIQYPEKWRGCLQ